MLPATRSSAPRAISHGNRVGAPVNASDAPVPGSAEAAAADDPELDVLEELVPELGTTVVVGVVAGAVVVVVVVLVGVALGVVKVTATVSPVSGAWSVMSVAPKVTVSAVLSVTTNAATPAVLVVPSTVSTWAFPFSGFRATVLPLTGLPLAS